MQIRKCDYDAALHDMHKALCVKQPYADMLTRTAYIDGQGGHHAQKSIHVCAKDTDYRGELLICSSRDKAGSPVLEHGVTCGFVELHHVKPIAEMTEWEWKQAGIRKEYRPKEGYAYYFRNPRRVIEMPIEGGRGIFDLVVPKGDIVIYPHLVIGKDGWKIIQDKLQ